MTIHLLSTFEKFMYATLACGGSLIILVGLCALAWLSESAKEPEVK